MPYIPPGNRPPLDEAVEKTAEEIALAMAAGEETAEIGSRLRSVFLEVARYIVRAGTGKEKAPSGSAELLAHRILDISSSYGQQAGWTGELNYAITRLIQMVPYKLYRKGNWGEPLRYWIYAEIVGALTRTAWDLHGECGDDFKGNGLCGVFIDIKDEYKRRVNTAYEAAQIRKSGDCYDLAPYRTALTPVTVEGIEGFQEVMLPVQELDR